MFADHPEVEVVGKAGDGEEALKLVTVLKPDVITLDLEMPRMDGFTFLRILMSKAPTPVIVVSSYSQRENVFKALELGRPRLRRRSPTAWGPRPRRCARRSCRRSCSCGRCGRRSCPRRSSGGRAAGPFTPDGSPASWDEPSGVAGRAVPGAPHASWPSPAPPAGRAPCCSIFGKLPATTTAAFVVAQHMPDKFTRTFAERLDKRGAVETVEASDGDLVAQATGFVCPGRKCMELVRSGSEFELRVVPRGRRATATCPAPTGCSTAWPPSGPACIGVILTGMGDDGVEGAQGDPRRRRHRHRRVAGDRGGQRDARRRRARRRRASEVLPLPQIGEYLAKV